MVNWFRLWNFVARLWLVRFRSAVSGFGRLVSWFRSFVGRCGSFISRGFGCFVRGSRVSWSRSAISWFGFVDWGAVGRSTVSRSGWAVSRGRWAVGRSRWVVRWGTVGRSCRSAISRSRRSVIGWWAVCGWVVVSRSRWSSISGCSVCGLLLLVTLGLLDLLVLLGFLGLLVGLVLLHLGWAVVRLLATLVLGLEQRHKAEGLHGGAVRHGGHQHFFGFTDHQIEKAALEGTGFTLHRSIANSSNVVTINSGRQIFFGFSSSNVRSLLGFSFFAFFFFSFFLSGAIVGSVNFVFAFFFFFIFRFFFISFQFLIFRSAFRNKFILSFDVRLGLGYCGGFFFSNWNRFFISYWNGFLSSYWGGLLIGYWSGWAFNSFFLDELFYFGDLFIIQSQSRRGGRRIADWSQFDDLADSCFFFFGRIGDVGGCLSLSES